MDIIHKNNNLPTIKNIFPTLSFQQLTLTFFLLIFICIVKSLCTVERNGIVHYFVQCLDQSTIGIGKNASHTQLIIESQLHVNFNRKKQQSSSFIIH